MPVEPRTSTKRKNRSSTRGVVVATHYEVTEVATADELADLEHEEERDGDHDGEDDTTHVVPCQEACRIVHAHEP